MQTNYFPEEVFCIASDQVEQYNEHLSGIAYGANFLIIGKEGLKCYRKSNFMQNKLEGSLIDGRFSAVLKTSDGYCVFTDPLGQDLVYYYITESLWIISNSFIYICEQLKKRL